MTTGCPNRWGSSVRGFPSSSVEASVVTAVCLLAKIGVLERVCVCNVNSSSWFEVVETVREGQLPDECCEVEGGDVWSSVRGNLHVCLVHLSLCIVAHYAACSSCLVLVTQQCLLGLPAYDPC
jgi:hypothetical protein